MDSKRCLQQFLQDHQIRFTPETLKSYERPIKRLVAYTGKDVNEISKRDIRVWLNFLGEKGFKPMTVKGYLIGLKTFFRYCLEEGYIKKNPVESVLFPKIGESFPKALTKDQLHALRKLVEEQLFDRACLEVLYSTGVRISELITMKKPNINWSNRTIWIPEGKRKKERIVLFTRECEEYLKAYLNSRKDESPYVFVNDDVTGHIYRRAINLRYQHYSEQLGFRVYPHRLRHTFASHLIQRGMPLHCVQTLMGHELPQTTQNYAKLYSHEQKEKYDEWM